MTENKTSRNDLWQVVADCREQANRQGERFNLFRIFNNHRSELVHSRFLSELLTPRGNHGEGDAFLEAFLRDVLGLEEIERPYKVRREFSTDEGRRIDLVIEAPNHIVGIELKIDAHDQSRQLHDYHKELKQQARGYKEVTLAYLTLEGNKPSQYSLGNLDESSVTCLSFSNDITSYLQKCIDKSAGKPLLAGGIQQYHQLLKDLTGKGGSVSDFLAKELAEDQDHLEKALAIALALPKAKSSIQQKFWEDLYRVISERLKSPVTVYGGSDFRTIAHDYHEKNPSKKDVGIKTPVHKFGTKTIYLYTHLYDAVHYGLRLEDDSGDLISSSEDRAHLRAGPDGTLKGNADADKHLDWLICFYFDPRTGESSQIINFNEFNEAASSLINDEARHNLIDNIVTHQIELAETAKRVFS